MFAVKLLFLLYVRSALSTCYRRSFHGDDDPNHRNLSFISSGITMSASVPREWCGFFIVCFCVLGLLPAVVVLEADLPHYAAVQY